MVAGEWERDEEEPNAPATGIIPGAEAVEPVCTHSKRRELASSRTEIGHSLRAEASHVA